MTEDEPKLLLPAELKENFKAEMRAWRASGVINFRAYYLRRNPEYAEYLELAQWIMKRHGSIRWRIDSQYDLEISYREMQICCWLEGFPNPRIGDFLNSLAKYTEENVVNYWADDEFLLRLVQCVRKRVYNSKLN